MTKQEYFETMVIEPDNVLADDLFGDGFAEDIHATFFFEDGSHFFLKKDGTFIIPIFNKMHKAETLFQAYDILWNEFVHPEWFPESSND